MQTSRYIYPHFRHFGTEAKPDFSQNTCLNAPAITGELKYVVLRLFKQVRECARKRLFDGFYIEPGTVLRCDGATSRKNSDRSSSAIFVCFPYLALRTQKDHSHQSSSDYPMRSILQHLYPYESTLLREEPPSFCKEVSYMSKFLMYIPQSWTVLIGSSMLPVMSQRNIINMLKFDRICHHL